MDPILLEVINNRLQSISNEMEDVLLGDRQRNERLHLRVV